MLHRIQTYYLGIIIIVQVIILSGFSFFRYRTDDAIYNLNAWGYQVIENDVIVKTKNVPVFIGFISIVLLTFICIMAYKNIERQFKLGRFVFFVYFINVLVMYLFSLYGDSFLELKNASREMGASYWLFIIGFPFSFMANINIKRDRKILDSLKRL